ncbi:MAG: hypothetical protein ABI418_20450 [Jatrophihabitantaceae bacterium]
MLSLLRMRPSSARLDRLRAFDPEAAGRLEAQRVEHQMRAASQTQSGSGIF